jgi:hypothetical protein
MGAIRWRFEDKQKIDWRGMAAEEARCFSCNCIARLFNLRRFVEDEKLGSRRGGWGWSNALVVRRIQPRRNVSEGRVEKTQMLSQYKAAVGAGENSIHIEYKAKDGSVACRAGNWNSSPVSKFFPARKEARRRGGSQQAPSLATPKPLSGLATFLLTGPSLEKQGTSGQEPRPSCSPEANQRTKDPLSRFSVAR